jgi:hypothetical protein
VRRDVEGVDDVQSLDGEEGIEGEREARVIRWSVDKSC